MKNLATMLLLLITTIGFSQVASLSGEVNAVDNNVKIESISIHVEVDSAEEVESTFKTEDIVSILDDVKLDEEISFKITCNEKPMNNGVASHVSYEVTGNMNNKKDFIKRVKKIRQAAIKYYKNKK